MLACAALGLYRIGGRRGEIRRHYRREQAGGLYSAFGAMSVGATFVGVYTTNPAKECEYVVGHSDSVVFICEDEEQLNKALIFPEKYNLTA